jgi:hypothetical protein
METQETQKDERLITRRQAMTRLRVSSETLRQWRLLGILVPVWLGYRSARYRERDVLQLMQHGLPPEAVKRHRLLIAKLRRRAARPQPAA